MGEIEALGDAVTGGMLGRAVEPRSGEGDSHAHETNCQNCGADLAGPYCHQCGQHAHVHSTLSAFFHDFLHGVLHFEGKIWRTLPLLAVRPGELTRRYIAGQRARFVSPIALFLFSVFVMFAVMHLIGALDFSGRDTGPATQSRQQQALKEGLADVRAERARAVARHEPTAQQDAVIAVLEQQIDAKGEAKPRPVADINLAPGLRWLQEPIEKALKNPDLLLYKVQTNAYKFSWLLIPISVPFLWLLLLHRRRYRQHGAYDHTVFITYSLSAMTLWLSLLTIFSKIVGSNDIAVMAFSIGAPVHMYRQLRGAYGLGRFSAAWRAIALGFFALLALSVFLLLLFALGAID